MSQLTRFGLRFSSESDDGNPLGIMSLPPSLICCEICPTLSAGYEYMSFTINIELRNVFQQLIRMIYL